MPLVGSKYSVSQFGYIPKSDTFKYLTVTGGLKEKRRDAPCYKIGNDSLHQIWQIPADSQNVLFQIRYHNGSDIGPYVMILPPAMPGLKINFVFSASQYQLLNADDAAKQWENMVLNDMSIGIKCAHTDAFRGLRFEFDDGITHRISKIPFTKGQQLAIETHGVDSSNNRSQKVKMADLLISHAEVECIESGYWKAKFYGPWTFDVGNI